MAGSPFKGSGARDHVTLTVDLAQDAELTVRIVDFDGHRLRTLVDHDPRVAGAYDIRWNGRDGAGRLVADGPYRFRVHGAVGGATQTVTDWVTKSPHVPYAMRPGAIVVAINPGHGGSDPGATVHGTMEKDMNLAISLRLRRMLEGAGIGVVMTRSTDRDVNRPATDRNGDGHVTHQDELVARNDVGDLALADMFINIHNNATACRCGQGTEVFVNRDRPWSAENLILGKAIQTAFIRRLLPFESASWKVHDNGIGPGGRYYSLRPANKQGPRPALMPADPGRDAVPRPPAERAKLRDPRVQTALAAGYFDGISQFLASRRFGIRYTGIQAPDRVSRWRTRHGQAARPQHRQRAVLWLAPRGSIGAPGTGAGRLGRPRPSHRQGRLARRHRARRGRRCRDPGDHARIGPPVADEAGRGATGGPAE